MNTIFFRTPYNHDTKAFSDESGYVEKHESLTNQSHAEDADINVIVRRYGLTGVMPVNHRVPEFGDYTGVGDYQTALEAVRTAEEHFMEMPYEVRAQFHNNPQEFLDFCSVKDNLPKMRELGLAVPEVVVDNTLADVVKAIDKLVPRETGGNDGSASEG